MPTYLYYLLFLLIIFIVINYVLDSKAKYKFARENFPPDIIYPLKENIELPFVKREEDIPKKIWRCYKKDGIHKFKTVFDKTQEIMPDYEQVIYDDQMIENFIQENYSPRIYRAYKHINPEYGASKADFFRYLILYIYGGVYMDIKTGAVNNFQHIIDKNKGKLLTSVGNFNIPMGLLPIFHIGEYNQKYDWSHFSGTSYMEYQQYYIICPKGHPTMGQIIRQVVSNIEEGIKHKEKYSSGHISVVAMTGPIMYTRIINKYPEDVKILGSGLDRHIRHNLIDYKNIMGTTHYSKIENKCILV